eukprot:10931148-Ditylum_brightwellii.AAC.1
MDHNKKASNSEHEVMPLDYLDIRCEDAGWSPLHYAAVMGNNDVVEALLAGGCNVGVCTEDTLTCRA